MNKNNLQRTYDLYPRDNNINIESENTFSENVTETQNNEKMFNIFNDIEKNIKEVSDNINETNKIQKMYALKNMENAKRIKKNNMNHFKTTAEYYPSNNNFSQNEKLFKYNVPSRIYKPNFDISNNFMSISNSNQFNTPTFFRSGEFDKINNYYKNEENNKTQENLNIKNNNSIKKGFIRRAKSTTNSNYDKYKDNINLSNNSNFSENRKKIIDSNKVRTQMLEDIKAFKLENQNLLTKNKSLVQKVNDYEKQIKEKNIKIKELEKKIKYIK